MVSESVVCLQVKRNPLASDFSSQQRKDVDDVLRGKTRKLNWGPKSPRESESGKGSSAEASRMTSSAGGARIRRKRESHPSVPPKLCFPVCFSSENNGDEARQLGR